MGHFQQELIAGVLATVVGGLILALLTGSGGMSKFFRFVLIVGILGAVGALLLSQMRGSGWRRRGDVPVTTHLTAVLAHAHTPVIPAGAARTKGAQPLRAGTSCDSCDAVPVSFGLRPQLPG
jgi:hypothetical protein